MTEELATDPSASQQRTLDIAAIAAVSRDERIVVSELPYDVDELYQQTIRLLPVDERRQGTRRSDDQSDANSAQPTATDAEDEYQRTQPLDLEEAVAESNRREVSDRRSPSPVVPSPGGPEDSAFIPDSEVLRERFLLAEVVGGYESLHDLINAYSPGLELARRFSNKVADGPLAERDLMALRDYQDQIRKGLNQAHDYLTNNSLDNFNRVEIHELHDLLTLAAKRDRQLTQILGMNLIHEVEKSVARLHEFTIKIQSVEHTMSGVFVVDSEVMFIPTQELTDCVNTIFEALGNPYFAEKADGVMLLAARNLLIEVVAFFSYYGKHQIYHLFQVNRANVNITAISFRIRAEIRKLFRACKQENKLVLKRVVQDAEREFEISVEAIQAEAEKSAIAAVQRIIPSAAPVDKPKKAGWFKRLLRLFG